MSDKIKKALPYIIVNLIGAVLSVLSCIFDIIGTLVGYVFMLPFLPAVILNKFFQLDFFAVIILALILNIAACVFIIYDKFIAGLIFAILFGSSFGAFIGTLANRDFKYAKIVRLVFNVNTWLCVCSFCSLYYIGSHF